MRSSVRFLGLLFLGWSIAVAAGDPAGNLRELAAREASVHRFSTLFTAQDVAKRLGDEQGLEAALAWCRDTAVTRVYLETFRDGRQADRAVLERARDRFRKEGLEVAGCVTPTSLGKRSNRWNIIGCYTDAATQDRVQAVFEFAAGLFDEVMIDDFWFTECSCGDCDQARLARKVTVGGRVTESPGDSWEDYRRELMLRMSAERVLEPVRRVNPRCRLILKFPQWYDAFHERGYEVERQTALFDRIWVGTETRDFQDKQWGGTPQYEAFFLMRWLGGIGGEKCGGGWYDWLGTTERTYVEQARQTVLGGARESMLFCYGGLQGTTGPANLAALRRELPDLFRTAREVRNRSLAGVAAYKPVGSAPGAERRVFDFVGMLGIPLVPTAVFPTNAAAAFFSVHALKDPGFAGKLAEYAASGRPVLLTDGLVEGLPAGEWRRMANVRILPVRGDPKSLLQLDTSPLDGIRDHLLAAWGLKLRAPRGVAFCLFADGSRVFQNFTDAEARVEVGGPPEPIPPRGWVQHWK